MCNTTLHTRVREFFDMSIGEYIEHYSSAGVAALKKAGLKDALSGKRWDALKFHLENRAGMSSKVHSIQSGPDDGAIKQEVKHTLSKMSDDDFNAACKEIGLPDQVFKK